MENAKYFPLSKYRIFLAAVNGKTSVGFHIECQILFAKYFNQILSLLKVFRKSPQYEI
jgi:hypothetical protein